MNVILVLTKCLILLKKYQWIMISWDVNKRAISYLDNHVIYFVSFYQLSLLLTLVKFLCILTISCITTYQTNVKFGIIICIFNDPLLQGIQIWKLKVDICNKYYFEMIMLMCFHQILYKAKLNQSEQILQKIGKKRNNNKKYKLLFKLMLEFLILYICIWRLIIILILCQFSRISSIYILFESFFRKVVLEKSIQAFFSQQGEFQQLFIEDVGRCLLFIFLIGEFTQENDTISVFLFQSSIQVRFLICFKFFKGMFVFKIG